MYKINGHYIYLTVQQYNNIAYEVSKNESASWRIQSRIKDFEANIELHKRIKDYLKNNFNQEYYIFNFYDKDAQDNIADILSKYNELSNIIEIFRADEIDFVDEFNESATGRVKIKNIMIKIYEKSFFSYIWKKIYWCFYYF